MSEMERLSVSAEQVRERLEAVDRAREGAYRLQREVTRLAASTIRAVHRGAFDEADQLLADAAQLTRTMNEHARPSGEVYYSGFVMDAQKEFAEAALLLAIVAARPLPSPDELGIEGAPYLNGLAEAGGELRRSTLDALKAGDHTAAAWRLEALETIYHLLVTFDYPDAIAYGLKRRLDMVRGVLERTQSDVLTTIRQSELQAALERLEARLKDV